MGRANKHLRLRGGINGGLREGRKRYGGRWSAPVCVERLIDWTASIKDTPGAVYWPAGPSSTSPCGGQRRPASVTRPPAFMGRLAGGLAGFRRPPSSATSSGNKSATLSD